MSKLSGSNKQYRLMTLHLITGRRITTIIPADALDEGDNPIVVKIQVSEAREMPADCEWAGLEALALGQNDAKVLESGDGEELF